jgi:hypothetical protein
MVHMLNLLKANSLTVLSRISIVYGNMPELLFQYLCLSFLFTSRVSEEKEKYLEYLRIFLSSNLYDFLFTVAVSLLPVHMKIAWLCFPFQCILTVISLIRLKDILTC